MDIEARLSYKIKKSDFIDRSLVPWEGNLLEILKFIPLFLFYCIFFTRYLEILRQIVHVLILKVAKSSSD